MVCIMGACTLGAELPCVIVGGLGPPIECVVVVRFWWVQLLKLDCRYRACGAQSVPTQTGVTGDRE